MRIRFSLFAIKEGRIIIIPGPWSTKAHLSLMLHDIMNSNTTLPSVSVALAATAGVALVLRAVKRSFSPTIRAKLSCRCGAVQGEICAKKEDSIRLHCYCEDCQNYAKAISDLDSKDNPPMTYPCGETHIVQVCKSAVSIQKGNEHIRLARKSSEHGGMFRYYAGCCHVPLMNTIDFLGYVGVFEDNLDATEREKYYGPFCFCTKEAVKFPLEDVVPDIFAPSFCGISFAIFHGRKRVHLITQ